MSDVLARICDDKRHHVAARKRAVSQAALADRALAVEPPRGFARALAAVADKRPTGAHRRAQEGIAEQGLDPRRLRPAPALAAAYAAGGAACLSVLTDKDYFQGEDRFSHGGARGGLAPRAAQGFHARSLSGGGGRGRWARTASCSSWRLSATTRPQNSRRRRRSSAWTRWWRCMTSPSSGRAPARRLAARHQQPQPEDPGGRSRDPPSASRRSSGPAGRPIVLRKRPARPRRHRAHDGARHVRRFLVGESLMRQTDVAAATAALLRPRYPAETPAAQAAEG